ncbi:MAG: hypothetical protein KDA45_12325, partial [Planctomycetales bacterium]|nr:hypothetical protein [Planctomycetales bacterium]
MNPECGKTNVPGAESSLQAEELEAQLAELVSSLADRLQAGEALDFEQLCRDYPACAAGLHEVWGALVVTEAAAATARELAPPANAPDAQPPSLSFPSL